jgi:hypothetical protein
MNSRFPKSPRITAGERGLQTPQEFAAANKVSVSWLAKARKRGDGPVYVRFGRSIRYFPTTKKGP